MEKPMFCICENRHRSPLPLCGYREADQRLCFRYIVCTIPILSESEISKPLISSNGCAACFVLDLVESQNVGFFMKRLKLSGLKSFFTDWVQYYSFQLSPIIVFAQYEQLSLFHILHVRQR